MKTTNISSKTNVLSRHLYHICFCLLLLCVVDVLGKGRGGSGAGTTVGRGGSGTSSGLAAGNNDDGQDTGDSITFTLIIIVIVSILSFFVCISTCIWCIPRRRYNKALQQAKQKVQDENYNNNKKKDVNHANQVQSFNPHNHPQNGKYDFEYTEGSILYAGKLNLTFDKIDNGWTIKGSGKDVDGQFTIQEGKLSQNGNIYWVECQDRINRKIVCSGELKCFDVTSFGGHWAATSGKTGLILSIQNRTIDDFDDVEKQKQERAPPIDP